MHFISRKMEGRKMEIVVRGKSMVKEKEIEGTPVSSDAEAKSGRLIDSAERE